VSNCCLIPNEQFFNHIMTTLHDVWAHWSYIWAQKILRLSAKKIRDWAHFTLAIYLRKKI